MPLEVPDSGPVLSNPIRDVAAVRRLRDFDPGHETRFVGDAIRTICKAVGRDVPVIGFAGAPWTLACYMIEGQTRGDISTAKRLVAEQPEVARELLGSISRATAGYLKSQIEAGACAVQLFDTWAGELSAQEFAEFELPAIRSIFEAIAGSGAPRILFAKGSSRILHGMAQTGADVLSVDWKTDLGEARQELGGKIALQGNVNPSVLLGPVQKIQSAALDAVEKTGGIGHILNLGHGILPNTPVENAKAFVEARKAAPVNTRVTTGAKS